MKRYIALLRGINISGKNKIAMAELKSACAELGYADIKTYLNSGNIAFSYNQESKTIIREQLQQAIKEIFKLQIPVYVLLQDELNDVLSHAPDWWGDNNKEIYDNLIFIIEPATFSEILLKIGDPIDGLEKIENYKDTIFWSFSRKDYQKTNWWSKTASADVGIKLTIRTANTIKKLCEL